MKVEFVGFPLTVLGHVGGVTILEYVPRRTSTINITTITGVKMKVKSNSFYPWKMVISNTVVAYMCCVDTIGTVSTHVTNSVEISKSEYDRLVRKFKVSQESLACMADGKEDT